MARVRVNTGGGKPAKERMFERRVQQENARSSPVIGAPAVMTFGKFKNYSVTDVDDGYLRWCFENMTSCPQYIIGELKRRGMDLSGSAFPCKQVSAQQANQWKKQVIAERQRLKALDQVEAMQAGIDIVGCEYPRLLKEFDRAGGDADECPFDSEDYQYTGPTISWNGSTQVISPSEFPKEFI